MKSDIKYSVVVPAYNEEENIPALYQRIVELLEKRAETWELIFINDGSTDHTYETIHQLSEKDKNRKEIGNSDQFEIFRLNNEF